MRRRQIIIVLSRWYKRGFTRIGSNNRWRMGHRLIFRGCLKKEIGRRWCSSETSTRRMETMCTSAPWKILGAMHQRLNWTIRIHNTRCLLALRIWRVQPSTSPTTETKISKSETPASITYQSRIPSTPLNTRICSNFWTSPNCKIIESRPSTLEKPCLTSKTNWMPMIQRSRWSKV